MARTYSQLVELVRGWCNRDEEAVSDDIIKDALRYAADKAYKTLRVPPLENVAKYTSAALIASSTAGNGLVPSKTEIQLPFDLIEFIQIREVDATGQTTRVFNEKVDIRTFNDPYAEKYTNNNYWTRELGTIYLSPAFADGSVAGSPTGVELYYYRRLPALDATYSITVLNYNAGLLDVTVSSTPNAAQLWFSSNTGTTAYITQALATAQGGTITNAWYIGKPVANWLKDQNERVLLFGALAEIFTYTQEDDQASKYLQLFYQEIQELNVEDAQRTASGGNVQINFNGRGLI